jgi:hypothetical protein
MVVDIRKKGRESVQTLRNKPILQNDLQTKPGD